MRDWSVAASVYIINYEQILVQASINLLSKVSRRSGTDNKRENECERK